MNFFYETVFYIILTVSRLKSTIKLVVNVINGIQLLNKSVENNERLIKGGSLSYEEYNFIYSIAAEIFIAYYVVGRLVIYSSMPFLVTVLVVVNVVVLAVKSVIHVIAKFKEKNVYLTEDGLVCFLGCFPFSKCCFSWEKANDPKMLSDTLHVYNPKGRYLFTVIFDSDIEIAHEITGKYVI